MKVRESDMPEEAYWESLFDISTILNRLQINGDIGDVIEIGCGYGTFTIPVAQRVKGIVYALDVDPSMIHRTAQRAKAHHLSNVTCALCDFVEPTWKPSAPVDGCLFFNILHREDPVQLLSRWALWTVSGGWIWVIHWRYDACTPRGPSMTIRPQPDQIARWAEQTKLLEPVGGVIDLPPWHYGWRFKRL